MKKSVVYILAVLFLSVFVIAVEPYPDSNPLGAIIHYKFDGNALDSIDSNNGLNFCSYDGSETPFGSGSSIYCDGNGDYFDTQYGQSTINVFNPITICGWVKSDGLPKNESAIYGATTNNVHLWLLYGYNDFNLSKLYFYMADGTRVDGWKHTDNLALKEVWTHFCTVKQLGGGADVLHVYINGTEIVRTGLDSNFLTSELLVDNLYLMARNLNGDSMNFTKGWLDDVLIFDKALDADEVSFIYNYEEDLIDDDQDGYPLPIDCDDNNFSIKPNATEVCNNVDDNCDGNTDEGFDLDGDNVAECYDNCPTSFNPNQQDSDSDSFGDACDLCQDSRQGELIDQNGCDPFQFCEPFYCGLSCYYADFMNNEPNVTRPNDCVVVIVHKGGLPQEPRCVPTECGN